MTQDEGGNDTGGTSEREQRSGQRPPYNRGLCVTARYFDLSRHILGFSRMSSWQQPTSNAVKPRNMGGRNR